jgi:hypothetical protein
VNWAGLCTIDSGAEAGCSLWQDRALVWCGLVKTKDLLAWHARLNQHAPARTVIELPIYHTNGKSKVSPSVLIRLGFNAGRLAPAFGDVETIHPVTWKGNLPDDILYRRLLATLTPEERALIPRLAASVIHNVWDSIGIGLHILGRRARTLGDINGML